MTVFDIKRGTGDSGVHALAVDSKPGDVESLKLPDGTGTPGSIVELTTGNLLLTLEGHTPLPGSAVTGYDKVAEVDPDSGQMRVYPLAAASLAVGSDGRVWAVGGGKGLARLDLLAGRREVVETAIRTGGQDLVAADPSGRYVWFTTYLKLVRYETITGQLAQFLLPTKEIRTETSYVPPYPPEVLRQLPPVDVMPFVPTALAVDAQGNAWVVRVRWPGQSLIMIRGN